MPTEIVGTMAVSGGQKQTALLMPGAYPAERVTGGVKVTELWKNPAPASDFAPQNVEFSSGDYDLLVCMACVSGGNYIVSCVFPKGKALMFSITSTTTASYTTTDVRTATYVDETHYSFGSGYKQNSNGARAINNGAAVPYAIYGIKLC